MEIEQNKQYALIDIEITDTETDQKTYRLGLMHSTEQCICVWWVFDKRLEQRAKELGVKMDFETCFPMGTTVKCKPEDLRTAVLSNPAAVVGEPDVFYKRAEAK